MLSSHQECSAADFAMFQTHMTDAHVFYVTTFLCDIVTAKMLGAASLRVMLKKERLESDKRVKDHLMN